MYEAERHFNKEGSKIKPWIAFVWADKTNTDIEIRKLWKSTYTWEHCSTSQVLRALILKMETLIQIGMINMDEWDAEKKITKRSIDL